MTAALTLAAVSDRVVHDRLGDLEDRVFGATPVLAAVRRAARSRSFGPWAVLGSLLARVVAEVPPHVVLPPTIGTVASLNLSVALVGGSGDGKSVSHQIAGEFLGTCTATLIGPGSGEGVIDTFLAWDKDQTALMPDPMLTRALLYADEVEQMAKVGERKGATFDTTLRSLWSGTHASTTNTKAGGRRRSLPAHTYRLAVVAGVQPAKSAVLMDDAGGTAQRWLFLPAADPAIPDSPPPWPGALTWSPPLRNGTDRRTGLHHMTLPEVAAAFVHAQHRLRQRDPHGGGLDSHSVLTRLKIAAALALLHGDAEVTDQAWAISEVVLEASRRTRQTCLDALASQERQRNAQRGRADAERQGAAEQARSERAAKNAVLLWRTVSNPTHANAKHEPDEPCTRRCFAHALRHHGGRAVVDEALAAADDLGWIDHLTDDTGTDRWRPGPSQPSHMREERA
jgi:hypothetical protein